MGKEQYEAVSKELQQAHKDLAFYIEEKENRAAELAIANTELIFQNEEKKNRAAELVIANKELVFQNQEKEKRAQELIVANKELVYQNQEKEKRAQELMVANKELVSRTKALFESEARFRSIMETIPQMAWTFAFEAEAPFFNKHWYDYTGLDYEQSKAGEWYEVIHQDDLQQTLVKLELMRDDSGLGMEGEIRFKRADGLFRWHLTSMLPIKSKHSAEVPLWIGTATDIHDLKLLQEQKDDFISIASHELKTPITTLTASLQLLNRMKYNPTDKTLPSLIERANKSLDKVNILIKDLLNVTQFNNGQLHLNKSWIILSELIEDCCPHVRVEGIYTIKTEGDLDLRVLADVQRIDQVMVNFINNAIKYSPGSKEVLVTIEKVNDMAKVCVTDKGQGIAADKIPYLFDRYFRADSSGSQYSGLGLGLYISGEIIRKHEGQIGADSELGKGSTFWFTLPINEAN